VAFPACLEAVCPAGETRAAFQAFPVEACREGAQSEACLEAESRDPCRTGVVWTAQAFQEAQEAVHRLGRAPIQEGPHHRSRAAA